MHACSLLHDAAAAGDVEGLKQLLEQRTAHLQQQMDVVSCWLLLLCSTQLHDPGLVFAIFDSRLY
jgi:uncharacterized protein HemY